MALKATIFKADIQISDMDRHYYAGHELTIARHPSETDERMMLRVLAFALYAHEQLSFTKGLSTDDEPDLWQKSLSDEIELWIDLGQPDEKRIRKAAGKSKQVILITYGGNSAQVWWDQNQDKFDRFNNLSILNIDETASKALTELTDRNMQLQCTIQDGQIWLGNETTTVEITPPRLKTN
ncbi:YaeQ family protein [Litoribacillus peritrichatus]|uniref:YaeQ family protein n=1 Tax=Litoribacillus peritrichatus TaxID=718191 RepID=A0ABP7MEN5_9GAMM